MKCYEVFNLSTISVALSINWNADVFSLYQFSPFKKISRMEHVFPVWVSLWGSGKNVKSFHKRIRLGVKVSSLKHSDM